MMFNMGNLASVQTDMTRLAPVTLQAERADKGGKGSFDAFLLEAMNGVNEQQMNVAALQQQVITDPDSVNPEQVTTAMAKANLSLSLAQAITDRLIRGWNEVTTAR